MPKLKSADQFNLVLEGSQLKPHKRKFAKSEGSQSSWYYFGIVSQVGFSIALPIAGGAIVGSIIDQKYQTYPRATLGLLALGIVFSFLTFYQTVRSLLKK